jgi:hypothetical protein
MLGKRCVLVDPSGGLATYMARTITQRDVLFAVSFHFYATEVACANHCYVCAPFCSSRRSASNAFIALQLGGDPKQRAVDGGAIVVGELDNACLDDETAEFNQMPGALAALDLPAAHVMPSQSRLPAVVRCLVALQCCVGCAEMPKQLAGSRFRKTSPHA